LRIEKLNATIYQPGQNVTAETLVTLLSTLKTVLTSRTHYRSWKFVLGRLFSLAGWILNTLSSNIFSDPFPPIFWKFLEVWQAGLLNKLPYGLGERQALGEFSGAVGLGGANHCPISRCAGSCCADVLY